MYFKNNSYQSYPLRFLLILIGFTLFIMDDIQQAVAEGRGVITSHNAGRLWNEPQYSNENHAVLVTGVTYDADGNIDTVIINDTGKGRCSKAIPASDFESSLNFTSNMNVTSDPIW